MGMAHQGEHVAGMPLENPGAAPGADVPEPDAAIRTAACQGVLVNEGDGGDEAGVIGEYGQAFARL